MKHWQETNAILERLAELEAAGRQAAIACVVSISGSAYRRPGARFLIVDDGSTLGGISGGCLEEDVRQNGLAILESGASRLLHYETGDDDEALWGLGLGCDGEVEVFVAPATRGGFAEAVPGLRRRLAGDAPFVGVTVLGAMGGANPAAAANKTINGRLVLQDLDDNGEDADVDESASLESRLLSGARRAARRDPWNVVRVDGIGAFVEVFEPPPYMGVCGAGDDAMPMVRSAADAGFRVVVVDHRSAYLTAERFPAAWRLIGALPEDGVEIPTNADTYVVLKTHNLARDKAWARRFLASPAPYVGLLGPRARCEEIAEIAADAERSRIFGPVGLDLGAEGAEQVGLAVVAEALAVRSGRQPGHLKDRQAPIHDPA